MPACSSVGAHVEVVSSKIESVPAPASKAKRDGTSQTAVGEVDEAQNGSSREVRQSAGKLIAGQRDIAKRGTHRVLTIRLRDSTGQAVFSEAQRRKR